jgi:hypothetical protein
VILAAAGLAAASAPACGMAAVPWSRSATSSIGSPASPGSNGSAASNGASGATLPPGGPWRREHHPARLLGIRRTHLHQKAAALGIERPPPQQVP